MDSSHMKSFKNMLFEVAEKVSDFAQEMDRSNGKTKKSHQGIKNHDLSLKILSSLTFKQKLCKSIQLGTITLLWSTKVSKILMYINRLW